MANTTNLLLSAKSTRARIISCFLSSSYGAGFLRSPRPDLPSLIEHVVQNQRVGNQLLSWFEPRLNLLQSHVVLQEVSTNHFHTPKLLVGCGNENKVAIVHVQD